ncbi:MAG: hypothetical protein HY710_12215 [Candidatus Latescibacteria bacterium]|nr:hypothetical protein [Candidatus Latescibacterota bacterium]
MLILAKTLELVGILEVTYALVMGIAGELSEARELTILAIGGAIFTLGWLLERRINR